MAIIDIKKMKELMAECQHLTIQAELEAERLKLPEEKVARAREIRKLIVDDVPSNAGGNSATKWSQLEPSEIDDLHLNVLKGLETLRSMANPGAPGGHIMSRDIPRQRTIMLTMLIFVFLMILLLAGVIGLWDDATNSCRREREQLESAKQQQRHRNEEASELATENEEASKKADELRRAFEQLQAENKIAKITGQPQSHADAAGVAIAEAKKSQPADSSSALESLKKATNEINQGMRELDSLPDSPPDRPTSFSLTNGPETAATAEFDKQVESVEASLKELQARIASMAAKEEKAVDDAKKAWQIANRDVRLAVDRVAKLKREAGDFAAEAARIQAAFAEDGGCPPAEQAIIEMVILIGALGGGLRLLASLVAYIGNRELRRCWLPHYWLMPLEGAALATIVYLVVRAGLLSGTITDVSDTSKLNLFNVYVYAGLAGMFAKDVTAKLRELMTALFKSKSADRDSLSTQQSTPSQPNPSAALAPPAPPSGDAQ